MSAPRFQRSNLNAHASVTTRLDRDTPFHADVTRASRNRVHRSSLIGDFGNTRASAHNIGALAGTRTLRDAIDMASDRNDYVRFTVSNPQNLRVSMRGLRADADVQLLNQAGVAIAGSYRSGTAIERINCDLQAGTYFVRVFSKNGRTNYNLSLSSRATTLLPPDNPPTPTEPADWTVMVYMSADNLEQFSIQDFQEMAAVGSNNNVNIVVQLDRTAANHPSFVSGAAQDDARFGNWTDTRRGLVSYGSTPGLNWGTSIGEVNMGDATTLQNFVTWGTTTYQADNYALVLWGHGSGFEVSFDDLTNDGITTNELNSVLSTTDIDLVGSDACLMGTVEFAHAIRDKASVFVGSQENIPGTGWDYTRVFQNLSANPTMTVTQFGSSIVSAYAQTYPSNIETLSAIDLTALRSSNPNNLGNALSQFVGSVMGSATSADLSGIGRARDRYSNAYGEGGAPSYIDIGNLFSDIVNSWVISSTIRTAAQAVLNAYSDVVLENFTAVPGRASGLSIYMSPRGYYPLSDYDQIAASFTAETQWDALLNWVEW
ncbi:MAG: clostripain-related cysteine peptidase [Oculatellaceae cyanobacterium bins.114]|nr:clostripain-related cysteine peptidase [Oculatellaceae cyanobacterium bins.114]